MQRFWRSSASTRRPALRASGCTGCNRRCVNAVSHCPPASVTSSWVAVPSPVRTSFITLMATCLALAQGENVPVAFEIGEGVRPQAGLPADDVPPAARPPAADPSPGKLHSSAAKIGGTLQSPCVSHPVGFSANPLQPLPFPRFDVVLGTPVDHHFADVQHPPAVRSWQRRVQAEWAMLVRALTDACAKPLHLKRCDECCVFAGVLRSGTLCRKASSCAATRSAWTCCARCDLTLPQTCLSVCVRTYANKIRSGEVTPGLAWR